MKKEATLYARPRIPFYLILIVAAVLLTAGFLVGLSVHKNRKLKAFEATIPSAEVVEDVNLSFKPDGTFALTSSNGYYSLVVLSDETTAATLKPFCVGGNVLTAVFMPADTPEYEALVLDIINQGMEIKTLYVPGGTDKEFLDSFSSLGNKSQYVKVKGGEYALYKDVVAYMLGSKKSLSFQLVHGENAVLYSYDEKVGSLFNSLEADLCIMPYEALTSSKLDTTYAFFPEADFEEEALRKHTDKYVPEYTHADLFCLSDGKNLSFGVGLMSTGRLSGE